MSMRGPMSYSAVLFAATCMAALCTIRTPAWAQPLPPCGTDEIAHATVSRVEDGRTFMLTDGREVRLAGIEVPLVPQESTGAISGGVTTKDALTAKVQSKEVALRRAEIASDRYGRLVAYVYAQTGRNDENFVQGDLVAAGLARVGSRIGSPACATALVQRETAARTARLGLWADPYYAVLDGGTPAKLLAQKGRFTLVEGKVVSVRESGATIYLNFSRRWSEGFAVTVLKRNERNFSAAGIDLRHLAGRRVLVRGFIEARGAAGSPRIEADGPEQIETANRD